MLNLQQAQRQSVANRVAHRALLPRPGPRPSPHRLPSGGRAPMIVAQAASTAAPAAPAHQNSASSNGAVAHDSSKTLPRSAVIGVLGGGQLGRMMALSAANLGVRMVSLDPTPDSPASWASKQVIGHFRDSKAIQNFVQQEHVDILTTEIEHIDVDAVEKAAGGSGLDMEPTPHTIRIIQDKFAQKQHFAGHGIPLPEFREIKCRKCMESTGKEFGFPFMLKSKRLAYDGKGNAVVKTEADIDAAVQALGGYDKGLYAEKWAPFVKELAVMVVRSRDGKVVSYPVVETIHKDSICYVTEAPAQAPQQCLEAAAAYAEKAIACLSGAGIFGVEMFLLADGSILLNEVAPRPHNSGHYTMDGCQTSQFENHVRAVLNWPLGDTSLVAGCSIMLNLLGEANDEEGMRIADETMTRAYQTHGANVHWYGKTDVKKGRKIGHINVNGATREEARARLAAIDPAAAAALARSTSALSALQGAGGDSGPAPKVGIIMGSDSDLATMKGAAQVLEEFGIPCEITVVSAHRTPERMMEYAKTAHKRGLKCIIAGAGGAAHLPGMVASMTPLPVIGVPVKPNGAYLDGMDALLSIVQMPKGVPVATVAIGNSANAGLLAVRIIASSQPELLEKMIEYQDGMREMVLGKAANLEQQGWKEYKVQH